MLTKDGSATLTLTDREIILKVGSKSAVVAVEHLDGVRLETQEQIEKRVTATRILMLGIFAFAFKKKKKNSDKFLTIDFSDDVGMKNVILMEGKDAPNAHSALYNLLLAHKRMTQTEE